MSVPSDRQGVQEGEPRRRPARGAERRFGGSILGIVVVLSAMLPGLVGGAAGPSSAATGGPPYAWTIERAATDGDTGWYTSIALDSYGNPYIAYLDGTNGTVKVAHRAGSGWTSERVDGPGQFTGNTNVAIGPNNTVQVAYYDVGGKAVKYAERGPSGWRITVVDSGLPDGYSRLVLDSAGHPALAYVSYTGLLRYASWNGTGWTRETADNVSILSRYVDLAFDAVGRPHISYYAGGVLRTATKTGNTWTSEVADPTLFAGWFSRICIDLAGILHIAYYDSLNGTLRWATKMNGSWTHAIIDGSNDSGWDLSLALDRDGRVQLAYYSRYLEALRYAVDTPNGWVLETVDVGGVVGWYTGIATDEAGLPHISYYDFSNGDLKYAEGRIGLEARTLGIAGATTSAATLRGELVALGNHSTANIGFSFRLSGTKNWTYVPGLPASAAGIFTVGLTNLSVATTYEFRAEAHAGNETSLGTVATFRLALPAAPAPPYLEIAASVSAIAIAALVVGVYVSRRRKTALGGKLR